MKKSLLLLYVIAFFAAVAMIGSAAAAEKIKVKQITGDVVTVDAAIKTLTVKGKKAEVVITADDKTLVKMDKEKKAFSDVKIGDRVTVKYAEIEGKNIARVIDIKTAEAGEKSIGAAKPAESAKPAEPAKPGKPAPKSGY